MPKQFKFLFPAPPPRPMSEDTARHLANVEKGADIDLLKQLLLEKDILPFSEHADVITTYGVLYTERNEETPSSYPKLYALVRIRCQGGHMEEWPNIEGMHEIVIEGYRDGTDVMFKRLGRRANPRRLSLAPLPRIRDIYLAFVSASA